MRLVVVVCCWLELVVFLWMIWMLCLCSGRKCDVWFGSVWNEWIFLVVWWGVSFWLGDFFLGNLSCFVLLWVVDILVFFLLWVLMCLCNCLLMVLFLRLVLLLFGLMCGLLMCCLIKLLFSYWWWVLRRKIFMWFVCLVWMNCWVLCNCWLCVISLMLLLCLVCWFVVVWFIMNLLLSWWLVDCSVLCLMWRFLWLMVWLWLRIWSRLRSVVLGKLIVEVSLLVLFLRWLFWKEFFFNE